MDQEILKVRNLTVAFNDHKVLDDLTFSVKVGDIFAVIGPNGAGKTVLFRALLGLIPYKGEIEWKKDVKIGYVPQKFSIDPNIPLSVKEFLDYKNREDDIKNVLASLGFKTDDEHHLHHHLLRHPLGALSGGELQKILIAFALLGEPDVLLFDEPTAGVDIGGEETIYNLLYRLRNQLGLTILLISHDLHIIYRYSTNVLCLNKEKVCFGPPREVLDYYTLEKIYGKDVGRYYYKK